MVNVELCVNTMQRIDRIRKLQKQYEDATCGEISYRSVDQTTESIVSMSIIAYEAELVTRIKTEALVHDD